MCTHDEPLEVPLLRREGGYRCAMSREVSLDHVEWSPSTDDEVPITLDGRRLDSKEKVLDFLAELEAQRVAEHRLGVG